MTSVTPSGLPAPIACSKPAVDPADRSIAPVALALLVAFSSVWILICGLISYRMLLADQFGRRVDAEVTADNRLRYVDNAGVHEISPPKYWRDHLTAEGKVRLSVPEGSTWEPVLADNTRDQLIIGLGMLSVGFGMVGMAFYSRQKLKQDAARRLRLNAQNLRVPAQSFRVAEERIGGSKTRRTVYRVFATFVGLDGRYYEAASDQFSVDPMPRVDLERLRVLFDRQQPMQSLVATDSLPGCSPRPGLLGKPLRT